MIVCLGYDVSFDLEDGRELYAPKQHALLFDGSGVDWPYCSVLIAPFRRDGKTAIPDHLARDWYGRSYDLKEGSVTKPPRDLKEWTEVGLALRIFYTRGSGRPGAKHEGDYEHVFGERGLFDVFTFSKKKLPSIYRRGRLLRLELGMSCSVTGRGFVDP